MNSKDFIQIGLNEREARLYNAVLSYGEANLGFLAKMSGIKRTTAYEVIEALIDKKLVTRTRQNKHYNYFANDPRDYRETLRAKKERLARIVPQLLELMPKKQKKINLEYFEGDNCIKDILRLSLKNALDEIVAWRIETDLIDDSFKHAYLEERKSKQIKLRVITNIISQTTPLNQNSPADLREIKFVPPTTPIEVDIFIYGDKYVSIFSAESRMGLIITSSHINSTLKNIFEVSWQALKQHD